MEEIKAREYELRVLLNMSVDEYRGAPEALIKLFSRLSEFLTPQQKQSFIDNVRIYSPNTPINRKIFICFFTTIFSSEICNQNDIKLMINVIGKLRSILLVRNADIPTRKKIAQQYEAVMTRRNDLPEPQGEATTL
jgi:hypothetical protein